MSRVFRRWEPAEDFAIRRLARSQTAWQIGQSIDRSERAVFIRAQRLGVRLQKEGDRRPGHRWSDAVVEQARCLHDEGKGPAYIAKALGIPRNTVRAFVHYRYRLGAAA